jgi:two-component system sensor histidine kinase AlgZ
MIVGLLVLHYLYLEYRGRMKMEAENVARLQALHSRIRPHFLFNSMNTVASLTRIDPAMAESVVEDLADLFRASLSDAGKLSNLGSELALAKQYLNIESQRLGTRLRVEWDLEGLPEEAVLPPLILQPLLENAVYHGIEPAEEGGEIVIHGRYRKNLINISIRNSQPEDSVESHREGNKMALENIHQRLDLLFGSKASLLVSHVDECYQMRLVFPHPWSPE